MLEIFRMQLRQMLGGRRKWLVVLCLVLPVLLTVAAVGSGGIGEMERELTAERTIAAWVAGRRPATAQRILWQGEDRSFAGGLVSLDQGGVRFEGKSVDDDYLLVVNGGWIVVSEGELWLDSAREGNGEVRRLRYVRRQDANAPARSDDLRIDTIFAIYLFLLYPQAICLLLALFYGTSVLGDELDGKTLTYPFTRPLPRWQFVVGKYLGIVASLLVPTGLSLLASWLLLGRPGGLSLFAAILTGSAFALLAYDALFVLFGFLVPRRALIVALIYGVFLEVILSLVPALVNGLTISYYLRSLVRAMLDIPMPREVAAIVGSASPANAMLVLSGIVAGALGLASLLAARREYVVKDSA